MLTFTKDDNNSYIITANEKFIGRLCKNDSMWVLEYNDVSLGDVWFPYGTSLELIESELQKDFNTWLNDNETGYFGELSHTEYEK